MEHPSKSSRDAPRIRKAVGR